MNVENFRQRLLTLERELSARVEREMTNARDQIPAEAQDAGDQSTIDELKDEAFAAGSVDATMLRQIRDALRRIEDGTFGTCVVDGEPIEEKRLEAMPWTPYCLRHQQQLEAAARPTPTM